MYKLIPTKLNTQSPNKALMPSVLTPSSRKINFFPPLTDATISVASLKNTQAVGSSELQREKTGFSPSLREINKSEIFRSPGEKQIAFGNIPKISDIQPGSPKNVDVRQLIRNLRIKPAVFQSLRPRQPKDFQKTQKSPTYRNNSEIIQESSTTQKQNNKSSAFLSELTVENVTSSKKSKTFPNIEKPKISFDANKFRTKKFVVTKLNSSISAEKTAHKDSSRLASDFDSYCLSSIKRVRFASGNNQAP